MPKRKPREDRSGQDASSGPFNQAFAELSALRGRLADDSEPPSAPGAEASSEAQSAADPYALVRSSSKLVVRKERKGRGGKTVTRIDGLSGPEETIAALARTMAKALGCGATLEDQAILLQGSQSPRAAEWLKGQGAPRVVIGDAPKS